MKKATLLLSFIFSFSYCQSIKSTFVHKYLNENKADEYFMEAKPTIYSYQYSLKKTLYKQIFSEILKDTTIIDSNGLVNELKSITSSENIIFKDLSKKIFFQEYSVLDSNFSVKDNLKDFNWELTDEEFIVKGYKCKKAISKTEKNIIKAWYCEDIPINDGPDRFYGLPGFILKIEIGEYSIIEIDQLKLLDEKINFEKPQNKSKYITWKELLIMERELLQKKINED